MNENIIETFLREMRDGHGEEIEAVALPEGTEEYVRGRVEAGDAETLLFMLRLGYLMGLNTGFAVRNGQVVSINAAPAPLKA